jgi:hypothetical protein
MGRAPRRIRDAADQNATVRVTSPEPAADCDAAASVFSRRGNVWTRRKKSRREGISGKLCIPASRARARVRLQSPCRAIECNRNARRAVGKLASRLGNGASAPHGTSILETS